MGLIPVEVNGKSSKAKLHDRKFYSFDHRRTIRGGLEAARIEGTADYVKGLTQNKFSIS